MISVPTITVHPDSILLSSQIYTDSGELYRGGRMDIRSKRIVNRNKLSIQSKKKLAKSITYMCHLAPIKKIKNKKYNSDFKFKISFVTLTLSSRQQHSDNEIKKEILQPFIDYMRKMHKVQRFIWKAERQKNGNIHFHILFDVFIHWSVIRKIWNKCQERLFYISNSHLSYDIHNHTISYQDAFSLINSTDVHSVKKISDLKRYLAKYMLKDNHRNRLVHKSDSLYHKKELIPEFKSVSDGSKNFLKNAIDSGRLWSCSYDLTNISGASDLTASCYLDELNKMAATGKIFIKRENYFTYIGFNYQVLIACKCTSLLTLLSQYLVENFDIPEQPI